MSSENDWSVWSKHVLLELQRVRESIDTLNDKFDNLSERQVRVETQHESVRLEQVQIKDDIKELKDNQKELQNALTNTRISIAQKIGFGAGGGAFMTIAFETLKAFLEAQ